MNYEDWSDVYIYNCNHCGVYFALDYEMNDIKKVENKRFWCPVCREELTGLQSEED